MQEANAGTSSANAAAPAAVPGGAEFVSGVLGSLPGVDVSDPALQAAVRAATGEEKKDEEEGDGKGKEKK